MRNVIRLWPFAALALAAVLFAASQALAGSDHARAQGELTRYSAAVPGGAGAGVAARYDAVGDSSVVLTVHGLRPSTWYGVQVRERPCGTGPAAAGRRFQLIPDPEQPSTNPVFANPVNEIWLDVRTRADGSGTSRAKVPWQFEPTRRAGSVMLHAERTHFGPADSGTAGPALACLTVAF